MGIQSSNIIPYKHICYRSSVVLFILASIYCVMVYLAGEVNGINAGYKNLIGIPNFYLFYTGIFPFVTAGIIYIATQNTNIRFFGEINREMNKNSLNKILFHRKLLLFLAIVFSLLITINDASEKGRVLPPYSLSFSTDEEQARATVKYFELRAAENQRRKEIKNKRIKYNQCIKNSPGKDCNKYKEQPRNDNSDEGTVEKDYEKEYFEFVTNLGYKGESSTGFKSFMSWYDNSSFIYKLEAFLNLIAAFVMSVFVAQFFLMVIAKDHIRSETRNLVLWILILCSLWIPCKIFSVYYYSLKPYTPPMIVWFSITLLLICILLAVFIKVEKNDMSKYATTIMAVISFFATTISIFNPEYFELALNVLRELSWIYGGTLMFVIVFSIYLVTDHMIYVYEKDKPTIPDNTI